MHNTIEVNTTDNLLYDIVLQDFIAKKTLKDVSSTSISNRRVQACDLHTGATVHLWRATVHPQD